MVAFKSAAETDEARRWTRFRWPHAIAFLRTYLREHWDVLKHAQVKDPIVGILALLEKFGSKTDS
jgi:hypothetical protein